MCLPATKGPRSLMRTTTHPLWQILTREPNGNVRCAAVRAAQFIRSPLAVRLSQVHLIRRIHSPFQLLRHYKDRDTQLHKPPTASRPGAHHFSRTLSSPVFSTSRSRQEFLLAEIDKIVEARRFTLISPYAKCDYAPKKETTALNGAHHGHEPAPSGHPGLRYKWRRVGPGQWGAYKPKALLRSNLLLVVCQIRCN